jgi:hypothetical protein
LRVVVEERVRDPYHHEDFRELKSYQPREQQG